MKLNMKPGQRGVIIKGDNAGRIVICDRLVSEKERVKSTNGRSFDVLTLGEPVWLIDGSTSYLAEDNRIYEVPLCNDSKLRPIRDSDGEDETFTWAGKPEKKEKETAQ